MNWRVLPKLILWMLWRYYEWKCSVLLEAKYRAEVKFQRADDARYKWNIRYFWG